jgi:uncharacterized protein YkwD
VTLVVAAALLLVAAAPLPADRLEAALLDAVNGVRREHGLPALRRAPALAAVAREHSRRMSEEGYFAHEDPGGGSAADRARAAGIAFRVLGENLAMAEGAADPVDRIVAGWMASPGHRRNILDRRFGETGIGVWASGDAYYVTQLFVAR